MCPESARNHFFSKKIFLVFRFFFSKALCNNLKPSQVHFPKNKQKQQHQTLFTSLIFFIVLRLSKKKKQIIFFQTSSL